ncbi:MAG: DUF2807 domain-containing protein [Clostridiales bacterium]|nr:DUF2807 domain-containing protein [Clostridiales bacterium]
MMFATLPAMAQSKQHHVVNVRDFTHLSVVNGINIDYKSHSDSAGMAVFDAPTALVNSVIFSNNGKGKLSIEVDVMDKNATDLPTVTVYSHFLTNIENMGDSTVRAFSVNAGPKFKAKIEGNGRLSIRGIYADEVSAKIFTGSGQLAIDGRCTKSNFSLTGVGAIQADQLLSNRATATINGTGSIGCHATEQVTVKGTGPGTVYYTGNPPTVKNRSINVKIKSMDK